MKGADLIMAKVLLGTTGSVAATLTPKIIKSLQAAGHEIIAIVTDRGQYFFNKEDVPAEIQVMSDKDEWPEGGYHKEAPVPHIDYGKWADVFLIAPLTADTLSDMAHGKADKFLTSTVLAYDLNKPLLLAPAMNTRMWQNPITKSNLQTVYNVYNATVIDPISKRLACGDIGDGNLARIEDIIAAVNRTIQKY